MARAQSTKLSSFWPEADVWGMTDTEGADAERATELGGSWLLELDSDVNGLIDGSETVDSEVDSCHILSGNFP